MANQRVSQLAQITAPFLEAGDLLLLSDITVNQSKKLTLGDLAAYLSLDGAYTGSLYGTSSYAVTAATASYLASSSSSYASTASWALNINTASYANASTSASCATTSSWSATASYALASAIQSVLNATFADYANTASYLMITTPSGNGTASFALTSSYVALTFTTISYSDTASWAYNINTASYANNTALAQTASFVRTSSYLAFDGTTPNGTASYAMFSQNTQNVLRNFGTFYSITQSVSSSQLDEVSVAPTFGGTQTTEFEVYGTINIPFTSSHAVNGRVELFILDRIYGYSQSLDFSPITVAIGGQATVYTGSFSYPFGLHGQVALNGLYEVYATASAGVFLEPMRNMRYKISSYSDILTVSPAEPISFSIVPPSALMYYSSSIHPGNNYYGSASQVIFSGSSDVNDLFIPPAQISNMSYLWTLNSLVTLSLDNNGVVSIGGLPTSCVSMSANNCALIELPNMTSGSIKWLNVPNNSIATPLIFPPTMSYLNIAGNPNVTLPDPMPYGMIAIIADGTGCTAVPAGLSNSLLTMSFATCSNLSLYQASSFPTSLTYWNSSGSLLLGNIPTSPLTNLKYVDVSGNNLGLSNLSTLAYGLGINGITHGYFSMINVPQSQSAPNIIPYLATLRTNNWTVVS